MGRLELALNDDKNGVLVKEFPDRKTIRFQNIGEPLHTYQG